MTDTQNSQPLNIFDYPLFFSKPDYVADSAWIQHIPAAFLLIEILKPNLFVELGTHHGTSYLAFCQAVEQLNLATKCYAIDSWQGDPHAGQYEKHGKEVLQKLREVHDPSYGSFSTLIQSTFDEAVHHFDNETIDLLHIDGYHTYEAVQHDFGTWLPKLSSKGVVVFHDINEYQEDFGVWKFWNELKQRYPSWEVVHGHGLGILAVGSSSEQALLPLLETTEMESAFLRKVLHKFGRLISATKLEGELRRSIEDLAHQLTLAHDRSREISNDLEVTRQNLQATEQNLEVTRQNLQATEQNLEVTRQNLQATEQNLEVTRQNLQATEQNLRSTENALADLQYEYTYSKEENEAYKSHQRSLIRQRLLALQPGPPRILERFRHLWLRAYLFGLRIVRRFGLLTPPELFDTTWYLSQYPDVLNAKVDPYIHYLVWGWRELRNPGPGFSSYQYYLKNPDVLDAGINPLKHFIKFGKAENRLAPPVSSGSVGQEKYNSVPRTSIETSVFDPDSSPYYEQDHPQAVNNPVVKLLAFYLPQFHPTAENNKFWGKGFTEWTNVTRAYPLFDGHYQPRLPGELGFYDLRIVDNLREQASLARSHNIAGFCIYRYWFNGKTVLATPLELLYKNKDIDIEYCLCWANENWTRRWDGFDREVLISQKHFAEDDLKFIADTERFFRDSRYIRIDNKPVLIVYNTGLMPDPAATARRWQNFCREKGYEGLYLIAVMTFDFDESPEDIGFDAVVQMPPHKHKAPNLVDQFRFFTNFEGVIHDYEDFASFYKDPDPVSYTRFQTVTPAWDNTARRGNRAGIIINSSPQKYQEWLHSAVSRTVGENAREERFVFLNAWNEWAEGAYLEPDRKYGYAYLNATSRVISSFSGTDIVFLGHDAARAGSQIVLLELVEWFAEHTSLNIKVVLQEGGVLLNRYRSITDTLVLGDLYDKDFSDDEVVEQIKDFCGSDVRLIYGNTCVVGKALSIFPYDRPTISHIHELESSIRKYCQGSMDLVIEHSDYFVAVSEPVSHLLHESYQVDNDKISVVKPFITLTEGKVEHVTKKSIVRNANTRIVWGCGTVTWRKGFDIFVNVALKLEAEGHKNFQFCWIGAPDADFPNVEQYLAERNAAHVVTYLGERTNPRSYFALGDLFFLSSREDPHPLVVLEAAEQQLPIACFSDTGGIPEFVGNDAGVVVPHLDESAMAEQIAKLLHNRDLREQLGSKARQKLVEKFTRQATMPRILSVIREVSDISPKVSVIVPAYNHAKHLRKRLDSIYQQTFQDFEVILLDDGSTDGTAEILQEYADRCANTTLVLNEQNSGSTFYQWAKGLKLAQAELIWIAEDDDFSELTFLEKTLPYFSDPEIKLVYCQSYAVDENDNVLFNYQQYTDDLSLDRWASSYIADAQYEVNFALAKKNTIPNASGVVFRKFDFEEWEVNWGDRRLAGDWAFYLYAIHGGKVAFFPEPLNYHRRHDNSNIKRYEFDERRFIESARVQRTIVDLYDVDKSVHGLMRQGSLDNWSAVYPHKSHEEFEKAYNAIIETSDEQSLPVNRYIQNTLKQSIFEQFRHVSDDDWFSMLKQSLHDNVINQVKFPGFPEAQLQRNFTGRDNERTLGQAYQFYLQVKRLAEQGGVKIGDDTAVCDFGCGWGRITRFFLKDVPGENVVGLDATEEVIEVCKATFSEGQFRTIPYKPPYNDINENSFDIIFAYSVFSHLNPILVSEVIQEFHRLLKPGGVVVITSRGKMFMDYCESLRQMVVPSDNSYQAQLTHCFKDVQRDKGLYEDGQAVFYPVRGGGMLPDNMYGEAALPPEYFATSFGHLFDLIGYESEDPSKDLDQVTIALQKL